MTHGKSKDWVFGFNSAESRIPDDAEEVQSKINRTMKRHCRLGCFATDVYEALVTVEREQKGEDIVGASYERGHSRPRMWDQYADEFRGVCLIFDKAKLDVNVKTAALTIGARVSSGRVIYKNPSATPNLGIQDPMVLSWDMIERVGIEIASRKHIDTHLQELFFHKSKDWTQEREWRWVVHSSDDQDFFVNFGDALLAIAIGDKFPDDCKSAVGKYCLEYNVDVAEMRWRNGVPQPLPLAARVLANGS